MPLEKVLLLAAVATYVVSAVLFAARILSESERRRVGALAAAVVGLALHSGGVVALFLLLQLRFRWLVNAGMVAMPVAFLLMGAGLMGSDEVKRLPPTLQSSWLVVHILFAKLTVASIAVASVLALVFLLKQAPGGGRAGWLTRFPAPAVLDDYAYRLVAFGFLTLTVMIIAGAIWANASWGSYWSWDPTETWSLVVWFVYGLFLHGRVTFRWKGRISAYFIVASFAFSLVAFFVLPYFVKGQHSQYMTG